MTLTPTIKALRAAAPKTKAGKAMEPWTLRDKKHRALRSPGFEAAFGRVDDIVTEFGKLAGEHEPSAIWPEAWRYGKRGWPDRLLGPLALHFTIEGRWALIVAPFIEDDDAMTPGQRETAAAWHAKMGANPGYCPRCGLRFTDLTPAHGARGCPVHGIVEAVQGA